MKRITKDDYLQSAKEKKCAKIMLGTRLIVDKPRKISDWGVDECLYCKTSLSIRLANVDISPQGSNHHKRMPNLNLKGKG